jgi:hypothetical protein
VLTWNYYKRRKQLNVVKWMQNNKITSYATFKKYLLLIGIEPPSKSEAPLFPTGTSAKSAPMVKKTPEVIADATHKVIAKKTTSIASNKSSAVPKKIPVKKRSYTKKSMASSKKPLITDNSGVENEGTDTTS